MRDMKEMGDILHIPRKLKSVYKINRRHRKIYRERKMGQDPPAKSAIH